MISDVDRVRSHDQFWVPVVSKHALIYTVMDYPVHINYEITE